MSPFASGMPSSNWQEIDRIEGGMYYTQGIFNNWNIMVYTDDTSDEMKEYLRNRILDEDGIINDDELRTKLSEEIKKHNREMSNKYFYNVFHNNGLIISVSTNIEFILERIISNYFNKEIKTDNMYSDTIIEDFIEDTGMSFDNKISLFLLLMQNNVQVMTNNRNLFYELKGNLINLKKIRNQIAHGQYIVYHERLELRVSKHKQKGHGKEYENMEINNDYYKNAKEVILNCRQNLMLFDNIINEEFTKNWILK